MGLSMRQVEAPTKSMAELVMQRHPHATEARATEPGTIQSLRPSIAGGRMLFDDRQGLCQSFHALLCEKSDYGIAVAGIQGLDGMCNSIDATRRRQASRQCHRKIDIVYNSSGKNFRI